MMMIIDVAVLSEKKVTNTECKKIKLLKLRHVNSENEDCL
jgi:hypothetical protein